MLELMHLSIDCDAVLEGWWCYEYPIAAWVSKHGPWIAQMLVVAREAEFSEARPKQRVFKLGPCIRISCTYLMLPMTTLTSACSRYLPRPPIQILLFAETDNNPGCIYSGPCTNPGLGTWE
jgi:hypothetical protein